MKKHSKLLALLLCAVLLVGALAIIVSADSGNVAKIGDTEYATLANAFANIKDGDTITLIGDASLDATVDVFNSFTIF